MRNGTRTVLITAALAGLLASAFAEPTGLNATVVKFCKEHMGKTVGNGECASLVSEAFKTAGAKPHYLFKEAPNPTDYVWGELVYTLESKAGILEEKRASVMSLQAGDILQLRDVRFVGKTGFMTYPHHTSVVLDVNEKAKTLTVLEQNVNGKRYVMEATYHLGDLKAGWIRAYRPVAR